MRHVIWNKRGFSLAEVMVSSAIAGFLAVVATIAFSTAMDIFIRTSRLMEAETEMLGAMYALKSTFAQSVNVVYGGNVNALMTGATNPNSYTTRGATAHEDITLGKIFTTNAINSTTPTATPSSYLIALALKETNTGFASGGTNDPDSKFYGTGVYFKAPALTTSGGLFIDQQNAEALGTATAEGGWVYTSPVNAPQLYTRFTEFHVEDVNVRQANTSIAIVNPASPGTYTGLTVLSAEFRMVMRYFTKGHEPNWRWCSGTYMPRGASPHASCSAASGLNANYKDVEKKVKVVFNNNAYERSKYLSERPLGYIYYFKSLSPLNTRGI